MKGLMAGVGLDRQHRDRSRLRLPAVHVRRPELLSGIPVILVMVGVYAISELLMQRRARMGRTAA